MWAEREFVLDLHALDPLASEPDTHSLFFSRRVSVKIRELQRCRQSKHLAMFLFREAIRERPGGETGQRLIREAEVMLTENAVVEIAGEVVVGPRVNIHRRAGRPDLSRTKRTRSASPRRAWS